MHLKARRTETVCHSCLTVKFSRDVLVDWTGTWKNAFFCFLKKKNALTVVCLVKSQGEGKMGRSLRTRDSPSAKRLKRSLKGLRELLAGDRPACPRLNADRAERLQRCCEFLSKHGFPGLLDDATILKDVIYLAVHIHPGEQQTIIVESLSLAAQRGQDSAAQIVLREKGRVSMLISINVFDWRVLAFMRPTWTDHLKETRLRSALDSTKDKIFPMLLRAYHDELNTTAKGCLHIVFLLGSKSHLLELLCAGADKWAPFPGRSISLVTVPDPDDETDKTVGTKVEISPGQTTMDIARKHKDQLGDKFHLLSSFKPTLQEMCLMTVRKHVGLLTRERISALPLPVPMQKKLLFETPYEIDE